MVGYDKLREEQAEARKQGKLMGIGICTYGEICAFGPVARDAGRRLGERHGEDRAVRQGHGPDRRLAARPGRGDHLRADRGATNWAWVSTTCWCCTATRPWCSTASGRSAAARTAVGGTALYYALQELKAKVKKFGAMLLESDDVTFADGQVHRQQDRQIGRWFKEIAAAAYRAMKLPPNTEPGLVATHFWEPPNFTFPFGAHIVVTEVDRDTGQVDIRRYVAVDDCGNILNPLIVDGQVHGGVAQGLGPGAVGAGRLRRQRPAGHRRVHGLRHAARAHDAVDRKRPHHHAVAGESAGREGRGRGGNHRLLRRRW